jgi:hypothetical protein
MPKYKLPIIEPDALTYEKVPGLTIPKLHAGYVRDPSNPWRQLSEWAPCRHRELTMKRRPQCGAALITKFCRCAECPANGRIVNQGTCDFCPHSDEAVNVS